MAEQTKAEDLDLEAIRETVVRNICDVFSCAEDEVTDLQTFPMGTSNILLTFQYGGQKYIYRHPGERGSALNDRSREAVMQKVAYDLGIDGTFIAMDAEKGWQIRRFFDGYAFDYHNSDHVARVMALLRKLHSAPVQFRWDFDLVGFVDGMKSRCDPERLKAIPDLDTIDKNARRLVELTKGDGIRQCYSHRDIKDGNLLINDDKIFLIDWEMAYYADPGGDLGTYICSSMNTAEEVDAILRAYFGQEPTELQKRHFYAYIAIIGWEGLYLTVCYETLGQPMDAFQKRFYHYAKAYSGTALAMYKSAGEGALV